MVAQADRYSDAGLLQHAAISVRFYVSANVVAVVLPECLCIRESRTNIVSKISWVFVDGIQPTFHH